MVFAILNIIAFVFVFVGCVNWGLVGIFNWNLVTAIFGARSAGAIIVYILVLLSALWLLFEIFYQRGKLNFLTAERNVTRNNSARSNSTTKE